MLDDELLICDALVSSPCARELLLDDEFGVIFNLPYGGALARTPAAIDRLVAEGVLDERPSTAASTEMVLSLSALGGKFWEAERRPVWPAFCRTSSTRRDERSNVLTVKAWRSDIARAFLRVSSEAGMHDAVPGCAVAESTANERLPYWKAAEVVMLEVPVIARANDRPDWSLYESKRVWWRTVTELLRSHRALAPAAGLSWPPSLAKFSDKE
jgi:hypothetical protein